MYAGTDRGVSGRRTAARAGIGLRAPVREFGTLAVDPAAGIVYAGAYGGGIYELKLTLTSSVGERRLDSTAWELVRARPLAAQAGPREGENDER